MHAVVLVRAVVLVHAVVLACWSGRIRNLMPGEISTKSVDPVRVCSAIILAISSVGRKAAGEKGERDFERQHALSTDALMRTRVVLPSLLHADGSVRCSARFGFALPALRCVLYICRDTLAFDTSHVVLDVFSLYLEAGLQ